MAPSKIWFAAIVLSLTGCDCYRMLDSGLSVCQGGGLAGEATSYHTPGLKCTPELPGCIGQLRSHQTSDGWADGRVHSKVYALVENTAPCRGTSVRVENGPELRTATHLREFAFTTKTYLYASLFKEDLEQLRNGRPLVISLASCKKLEGVHRVSVHFPAAMVEDILLFGEAVTRPQW